MEQNYDYLKGFKKEELIKFYRDKEKQLNECVEKYNKALI